MKAVSIASTRDPSSTHRHGPVGIGADVAFGWAGQRGGPRGWSARFEYEVLPYFDPDKIVSALYGVMPGFEFWRSGADNWGFSLPFAIVGGVRLFPVRATFGVGIDALLVDQVNDDTGVGLFAPFALGKLAVDIAGVQLGLDARAGYRWQFGAEDRARWQLSIYTGFTAHPPDRGLR